MEILSEWKRFMLFGCTHGALVDQDAVDAVDAFRIRYKPHRVIHAGDVCDYAAFRSGAKGTRDEVESLRPDIEAGSQIIERFECTDVLIGNHDVRVWKMCNSPNAVWSLAAGQCRNEFLTACNRVHANVVDHYDIRRSFLKLGDGLVAHGWMYSENALRDHAEHFGKIIIVHLHASGMAKGRRLDSPTAWCASKLADTSKLEYAHGRRATARWDLGFVWGEYNDHYCHVNLSTCEDGNAKNWRLPL